MPIGKDKLGFLHSKKSDETADASVISNIATLPVRTSTPAAPAPRVRRPPLYSRLSIPCAQKLNFLAWSLIVARGRDIIELHEAFHNGGRAKLGLRTLQDLMAAVHKRERQLNHSLAGLK